jgi:hypothetical protein
MTGYLPTAIVEELEKSLKKKAEKKLNMTVRFDNVFYPILRFSETSFAIRASHQVKLRGLVDIYIDNKHTHQALIIASDSNSEVINFNFKRNTATQIAPPLDFECEDNNLAGLLTAN